MKSSLKDWIAGALLVCTSFETTLADELRKPGIQIGTELSNQNDVQIVLGLRIRPFSQKSDEGLPFDIEWVPLKLRANVSGIEDGQPKINYLDIQVPIAKVLLPGGITVSLADIFFNRNSGLKREYSIDTYALSVGYEGPLAKNIDDKARGMPTYLVGQPPGPCNEEGESLRASCFVIEFALSLMGYNHQGTISGSTPGSKTNTYSGFNFVRAGGTIEFVKVLSDHSAIRVTIAEVDMKLMGLTSEVGTQEGETRFDLGFETEVTSGIVFELDDTWSLKLMSGLRWFDIHGNPDLGDVEWLGRFTVGASF